MRIFSYFYYGSVFGFYIKYYFYDLGYYSRALFRVSKLGTYPYLETLTLFVSPRTAVSWKACAFTKRVRVSGPTLGIIFLFRVRFRVYNGL